MLNLKDMLNLSLELAVYFQTILDELESARIRTNEYNLPDWEETNAGFHDCLEKLFKVTPPTALIIDETPFFVATGNLECRLARGKRRCRSRLSTSHSMSAN